MECLRLMRKVTRSNNPRRSKSRRKHGKSANGDIPSVDLAKVLNRSLSASRFNSNALLDALRMSILARGGIQKIAKRSGLGRPSIYKILRKGAKPGFSTIVQIVAALNLKVAV